MFTKFSSSAIIVASLGAAILSAPAHAQITGTLNATITLESGCIINGTNTADGAAGASFGSINFATQTTLFSQTDGEAMNGGSAIAIECTTGVTPTLSFGIGSHDVNAPGSALYAMKHTTSALYVGYNLFATSARTTALTSADSISVTSGQPVNIYGRAYGNAGLLPGTYNDTVTVTLTL